MAQTGLPGQPEIAAPVHTAGIADGAVMVLRLASSGRFNARVPGRRPYELVFQVFAGRSQRAIVRTRRYLRLDEGIGAIADRPRHYFRQGLASELSLHLIDVLGWTLRKS